jgi:hypothetical protein
VNGVQNAYCRTEIGHKDGCWSLSSREEFHGGIVAALGGVISWHDQLWKLRESRCRERMRVAFMAPLRGVNIDGSSDMSYGFMAKVDQVVNGQFCTTLIVEGNMSM